MRPSAGALVASLALLTAASCSGGGDAENEGRESPPNILLVVSDDQRADTLRFMPQTRRLFVGAGTKFSRAYATTPQCCPSRASILSGRYAHNHGVVDNWAASKLDENATIQKYLNDAGYRTAIVGKYLNAPGSYYDRKNAGRNPRHFDHWSTFLGGYADPLVNIDGRVRTVEGYSTDIVASRGIRELRRFERDDGDPWLLYLAPFAPHPPSTPAPTYRATRVPPWRPGPGVEESDRADKPPFVQAASRSRAAAEVTRRRHLRTLRSLDDLVASTFAALREHDETRDTLAIFMSDNGFLWGEHGLDGKGVAYRESVEIPLAVRWPGQVAAGEIDERLVANIDIAPTILDAAGTPSDVLDAFDGRSILSSFDRDRLLLEHAGLKKSSIPRWASLVAIDHQYVEYYDEGGQVVYREYYDLTSDPSQLENLLAGDDPGDDPDVAALEAQLAADLTCVRRACP